jgi:hypothetical protein
MSHLSNSILLNHARLKAEQRSVGRHSPQEDRERVANDVRRIGDQIEMAQYIRAALGWTGARSSTWVVYLAITQGYGRHRHFPKDRRMANPSMRRGHVFWSQC